MLATAIFAVLASENVAAEGYIEERLNSYLYDADLPNIHDGKLVVREDSDIYMYNLETGERTAICTNSAGDQYAPDIWGDIIVWRDSRNVDTDIYAYSLVNNTEWQITSGGGDEVSPAIYENIIVWSDGNIQMHDITTGQTMPVYSNPFTQAHPDIHENIIVWDDSRNGNLDIYMYDLATSTETRVTNHAAIQQKPSVYDNYIVWDDARSGGYAVWAYDIASSTEFEISGTFGGSHPQIYDNNVVWEFSFNNIWYIQQCDLDIGGINDIQYSPSVASYPVISENWIAWDNDGGGIHGIYLDHDLDGIPDSQDAFPNTSTEYLDTDGDGIGDNLDTDADGDGWLDDVEILAGSGQLNGTSVPLDTDGDGQPDIYDLDDDNDTYEDEIDDFPKNSTEYQDTDNDGIGDVADLDDDNDGIEDVNDTYPLSKINDLEDAVAVLDDRLVFLGDHQGDLATKLDTVNMTLEELDALVAILADLDALNLTLEELDALETILAGQSGLEQGISDLEDDNEVSEGNDYTQLALQATIIVMLALVLITNLMKGKKTADQRPPKEELDDPETEAETDSEPDDEMIEG